METATPLPERLERLVTLFGTSPREIKVQALVDYADRLGDVPEHLHQPELLERVHECQTPFFVATEIDEDGRAHLYFQVPRESPTMRGYAGILAEGLEGLPVDEILAVPDGFYTRMGLADVVSQMRLRGMSAILSTIKEQLRNHPRHDGSSRSDASG